ncbi:MULTISPECIES: MFS transporter [unclassified Synechococcus]|uniref:MFS transporter n=1 Tax=unclassified Synechococcus TaxID=2626047 RepID=UPI0000698442|nr:MULTISPECIES: MFS transporter [unclassified Synechococcus]EAQ75688.1 permease of the major facilitator superfamily protein [Synechococcus sp. WH 5701]WFN59636.1 MFS transporter [Synechococcus sp. CCFWC 502]CAK6696736.1 Tetracycline resistance protein, class C [Synechococcus sp. CBW1107]
MGWSRPSTRFCIFLTLLNDRLGESIVFPLLPFLLASFTSDGRTLGLLAGSYALAQFLFTPLIGALSDRFGRKPVIAGCVAGSVLGLGGFALTLSLPWPAGSAWPLPLLFGARLIDGVSGGTAATAGAVLADISPPEKRAKAFGLIGVAFGLGFILGPALGGLLAGVNVTLPLLLAVAVAAVNLVLVLTVLPETHPPAARLALPRKRELNPLSQLMRVFRNPRVRRLSLAFFLFFLGFNGFTAVLVLYFKQVFGWGPELAAMAFLVVGVVATVVQGGLIGPLVQRFGEGRLSLAGLGLVVAGCLLIPLATEANALPVVFTALALLACGTGLVTPCLRSQVSRRLDDSGQGAALGSLQGLQSLGSFIGPPLAGLAYDLVGKTSPFWAGIALFLVVALLVAGGGPLSSLPASKPATVPPSP